MQERIFGAISMYEFMSHAVASGLRTLLELGYDEQESMLFYYSLGNATGWGATIAYLDYVIVEFQPDEDYAMNLDLYDSIIAEIEENQ